MAQENFCVRYSCFMPMQSWGFFFEFDEYKMTRKSHCAFYGGMHFLSFGKICEKVSVETSNNNQRLQ